MKAVLTSLLLLPLLTIAPHAAEACGGGVVSDPGSPVTIGGQRAFISVRSSGTTDIVVQLDVADAAGDYGILLPLPVEPTVDANPIATTALDQLDESTRPVVGATDGGVQEVGRGCGCGGTDDGALDGSNGSRSSVKIGSFTEVGPVTATALTADDSADLLSWLSDNGFEIPAADQSIVDGYIGAGSWFLAFKRNDNVPPGRSSLGVHFTLDGDHRGYPLNIARLGAPAELPITVWIAHDVGVTPAAPFDTITPFDLGAPADDEGYANAMAAATADRTGKLFVAEYSSDGLGELPAQLEALRDPGNVITRLSTVIAPQDIDQDTAFTGPPPPQIESELAMLLPRRLRPTALMLTLALGAALLLRRRLRPLSA